MRHLNTSFCLAFAICALAAHDARAQGGPPMLTDDPDTPGNGHVELDIAATVQRGGSQQSGELPAIDLNYGVGEHIQLNLETSYIVSKRSGQGPIGGAGNASAAVKWRFLDQESDGISMSAYPRVEWNPLRSSVRRGLVEDGTRLLLPVQIARRVGVVDLDTEVGSLLSSIGRCEWIYGLVAGTAVTSSMDVMAELHGTARTSLARDGLTLNIGLRRKLSASASLIASLGRDVRSATGVPLSSVGYFGVQLMF